MATAIQQKPKGQLTVIREYFGALPGQSLMEFAQECKKLSAADKLELAQGAAINMGLMQEQVDFPLAT